MLKNYPGYETAHNIAIYLVGKIQTTTVKLFKKLCTKCIEISCSCGVVHKFLAKFCFSESHRILVHNCYIYADARCKCM